MVSNELTARIEPAEAGRAVLGILIAMLVVTSGVGVAAAVPDADTGVPVSASTADAGVETSVAASSPRIETTASVRDVSVSTASVDAAPGKRLAAQGSSDALSAGQATVTGQVFYEDRNGNFQPARQVKVVVQDKDVIEKEVITSTRTNDRGEFTLTFDASAFSIDWGNDASVVVEAYANNPAAYATTGLLRDTYEVETDKFTISNGETKSLGGFAPSGEQDPWQAVDWALDARRDIADKTNGWTRDQVRIQYPQGDGAQYTSVPAFRRISLPDSSADYWDRNTVIHEYGHSVMDGMYEYQPWEWPVPGTDHWSGCHIPVSETDTAYAWIEGWAEFTEAAVTDNPRTDGMHLERGGYYDTSYNGDCFNADANGDMDGARVEGAIASILWDLYDGGASDDDGLDYSYGQVIRTVDNTEAYNAHKLWDAFRTDSNHEELRKIFFEHGIVKSDRFEGSTPTLSAGDTVDAQISRDDVDRFEVDLDADERLTADVSFDHSDADVQVTIEGPGGNSVAQADTTSDDEQASVTASEAGTYTVVVEDQSQDSATYSLSVGTTTISDDSDDSSDGTVRIPDSTLEDLEIIDGLDSWWFEMPALDNGTCGGELDSFHLAAGQNDSESVSTTVSGDCDVRIRVEPHSTTAGADLDLYATLDGRTPTTSDFDRKSVSAGSAETVVLDASELDAGTTVGVTLDAYSGYGNATVVVEEVDD